MRQINQQVVTTLSVGTGSFVSSSFWMADIVRASFQVLVSSGTCNGTFILQASNDQAVGAFQNQFSPANWNSLNSVTLVCSTTATGQAFYIQPVETCYEYGRIQFTAGNGGAAQGTVTIRMKGFNI